MEPLHYQVLVKGNIDFFLDFCGSVPFTNALYVEMVKKWKMTTANQKSKDKAEVANLKIFLSYLSDQLLKLQLVQVPSSDLTFPLLTFTRSSAKSSQIWPRNWNPCPEHVRQRWSLLSLKVRAPCSFLH